MSDATPKKTNATEAFAAQLRARGIRGYYVEGRGLTDRDDDLTESFQKVSGRTGTLPSWNRPVVVEHHSEPDGQGFRSIYVREFANGDEFVNWLGTAEYILPENGDGPEANGWKFLRSEEPKPTADDTVQGILDDAFALTREFSKKATALYNSPNQPPDALDRAREARSYIRSAIEAL
jgi:hypothetical protein